MKKQQKDDFYSKADIMQIFRVGSETVRRWIAEGRLPKPDVEISMRITGWYRSTLEKFGIRLPTND